VVVHHYLTTTAAGLVTRARWSTH